MNQKARRQGLPLEEIPSARTFFTSAAVEYTDASVPAVVDLIPPQGGVAVRFDPHSGHGVVKDLIVLDEAQA